MTTLKDITPKESIPSSIENKINYRELGYNELKTFAKDHGIDLGKYRKKSDIVSELDCVFGQEG